jgi:hypothetical protein
VAGARGDLATASRHFESAAREQAGAEAWLAYTLADHADTLIAAGDESGGDRLADRARGLARTHGLDGLAERLDAARAAPSPSDR